MTRLTRRKCSLNRSRCIGTNHVIVYPRLCYYINLTTCGAGLSPRDIHCFCLTTSFTYDIEERGRVSRTFQDWTLIRDVLFRKREELQNSNRALESPEDTRHNWPTASIFTPMFHIDDIRGELRRNGTGFSDAFKLTKLMWTVTLE